MIISAARQTARRSAINPRARRNVASPNVNNRRAKPNAAGPSAPREPTEQYLPETLRAAKYNAAHPLVGCSVALPRTTGRRSDPSAAELAAIHHNDQHHNKEHRECDSGSPFPAIKLNADQSSRKHHGLSAVRSPMADLILAGRRETLPYLIRVGRQIVTIPLLPQIIALLGF